MLAGEMLRCGQASIFRNRTMQKTLCEFLSKRSETPLLTEELPAEYGSITNQAMGMVEGLHGKCWLIVGIRQLPSLLRKIPLKATHLGLALIPTERTFI